MAKMLIGLEQLLKPPKTVIKDRNVWGLPLQGLWVPFFKAANVTGETNFSHAALGSPLRHAVKKDGTPIVNDNGEVRMTVEKKEIAPAIKGIRENFAFALSQHVQTVQKARPAEYKALEEACQKAGDRVRAHEDSTLASYLMALEEAQAAVAKAQAAKSEAPATIETRELVPA